MRLAPAQALETIAAPVRNAVATLLTETPPTFSVTQAGAETCGWAYLNLNGLKRVVLFPALSTATACRRVGSTSSRRSRRRIEGRGRIRTVTTPARSTSTVTRASRRILPRASALPRF